MLTKSKVLVLDIETAPILAYVWGLHDQNLGVEQIQTDWYVMAWAAKWHGTTKMMYADKRSTGPGEDKEILKKLWPLLNEADIVITQNGKSFDSRKLNARFMVNGMQPPKPYKHWDTYLCARQVADFTSNKLSYLTATLNEKYTKSYHRKFPGFSLWSNCLKGNKAAWEEMKRYNILDVLATEELYTKLRAWAPDRFPSVYIFSKKEGQCGTCGYNGKMREGRECRAKVQVYKQFQCPKCGAWQKSKKGVKRHA